MYKPSLIWDILVWVILLILSRIIQDRLDNMLPKLISSYHFGFIKGTSIIENVLLFRELVTDITKEGSMLMLSLNWTQLKHVIYCLGFFLMNVLRKMGFGSRSIDIIWRIIANNYYSVLINGQSCSFSHPTRGMKQGDPRSLSLFILEVEVLFDLPWVHIISNVFQLRWCVYRALLYWF